MELQTWTAGGELETEKCLAFAEQTEKIAHILVDLVHLGNITTTDRLIGR